MSVLVVGTRGSRLALTQTQHVVDRLGELNPGVECQIRIIKTTGDRVQDVPLARIGDKGLFVKEIELALMRGEIDFAVHSAKDLPSEMDESLTIAAYPEREDPSDALVSTAGKLAELPSGAKVGTSSVRRKAQLLAHRPDLDIVDLRGNLDTRLRKVETPDYDAVVLALAGLRRMGLESCVTEVLGPDVCLPAVGQGALAVQCLRGSDACGVVAGLDDANTRVVVAAERALLRRLGAGCQTPIAALGRLVNGELRLDALVAGPDGTRIVKRSAAGQPSLSEELGVRLAEDLLNAGADGLLEQVRRSAEPKSMGAA